MAFIEQFLGISVHDAVDEQALSAFVAKRVEENLNLEYKRSAILNRPVEVAKVVSSFANSDGGLLIVGISEKEEEDGSKVYPEAIDWDTDQTHTKEWFETVVVVPIRPPVAGTRVLPIRSKLGTVYLVDVPASTNPPHMAPDNKYYQRSNFHVLPMEHYQVADSFGKRRRPCLEPSIEISGFKSLDEPMSIHLGIENVGAASAKSPNLQLTLSNCSIGAPPIESVSLMEYYYSEHEVDAFGVAHETVFYSTNRVIHTGFSIGLQRMTVKLGNSLTLVVVIVGAEEALTEYYLTILGPDLIEHNLRHASSHEKLSLPLYRIGAESKLDDFVEWLQQHFVTDIMDLRYRSMKPQQLMLANRPFDMSKIYEIVRSRQQWPTQIK